MGDFLINDDISPNSYDKALIPQKKTKYQWPYFSKVVIILVVDKLMLMTTTSKEPVNVEKMQRVKILSKNISETQQLKFSECFLTVLRVCSKYDNNDAMAI